MLALLLALAAAEEDLSYFRTGIFQPNRDPGLYKVDLGLPDDLAVSSYGYFDDDKYCDIVLVNSARDTAFIYTYDREDALFSQASQVMTDGAIISSIPGDFDYDGTLDLMLTVSYPSTLKLQIWRQSSSSFSVLYELEVMTQPAVADLNGDLRLDFITNLADASGEPVPVVGIGKSSGYILKPLEEYFDTSLDCIQGPAQPLSEPHSVAYIDLNKDCIADLFLTTVDEAGKVYFEVFLNNHDGGFCRVYKEQAPNGARQVAFSDVDRNGSPDLIFQVCEGESCVYNQELHILFNDNESSDTCSFDSDDISKDEFKLKDLISTVSTPHKLVIIFSKSLRFFIKDPLHPMAVRLADFDLDGFPDLLVSLYDPAVGPSSAHAALYWNSGCGDECGEADSRRTFKFADNSEFDKLGKIEGGYSCSFFDLDENGSYDIIVNTFDSSGRLSTHAFFNNFLYDAFYLKTLILNGYEKQAYSSSYPGASFMFTLTELDMDRVQVTGNQQPLTAYSALCPPYVIFGLGRTNSYVENFYMSLPLQSDNDRMWTPIIPNSYLILSPHGNSSSDWFLELFANPTENIGIIVGVSLALLLVIGAIVLWRFIQEKREDRKHRYEL